MYRPIHSCEHCWWKQPFRVFGTGFDRPSAGLETAKNVLSYPSRHILSQHPHSHPSEWVPRGHRGRPNRQHSKNGWKVHQRSSHSVPYKPHGVGTRKHFFGSKSKKTKRFMIFDPKKGGDHFLTPLHPPFSLKSSEKWVSSWGGLGGGGVRTKTHWGMRLLDKIMILQGVKPTIQPLGVGYAIRPKKAQNGGYVAFPPIYTCLALIKQLLPGDFWKSCRCH